MKDEQDERVVTIQVDERVKRWMRWSMWIGIVLVFLSLINVAVVFLSILHRL